jgi:hypothetical protein
LGVNFDKIEEIRRRKLSCNLYRNNFFGYYWIMATRNLSFCPAEKLTKKISTGDAILFERLSNALNLAMLTHVRR